MVFVGFWESKRLATAAFRSSPITSLHVESNVLPLDFHRESLAVKDLFRPYFLPSSPLRSLLCFWGSGHFLLEIFSFGSHFIVGYGHLSYVILLWSMRGCTPQLFPSILLSSSLVKAWAMPLFFQTLTRSSLFLSLLRPLLENDMLSFSPFKNFVPRQ